MDPQPNSIGLYWPDDSRLVSDQSSCSTSEWQLTGSALNSFLVPMPRDPEFEIDYSRFGSPSLSVSLDNRLNGVDGLARSLGGCGAATLTGATLGSYSTDHCASLHRYLTEPRRDEMRALGLLTDAVNNRPKLPSDLRNYLRYADSSHLDISVCSPKLSDDDSWSAAAEVDFPASPMERYIYTKEPHEIVALGLRYGDTTAAPEQGASPCSDESISLSGPSPAGVQHSPPSDKLSVDSNVDSLGAPPFFGQEVMDTIAEIQR